MKLAQDFHFGVQVIKMYVEYFIRFPNVPECPENVAVCSKIYAECIQINELTYSYISLHQVHELA